MNASISNVSPRLVLAGLQQPPAAVAGQDNPWDYVQDAFRRLADPSMESGSPLSLDTLMSGRPALLDKVPSRILRCCVMLQLLMRMPVKAPCCALQGLGAINAVGKAAVHVANSLDNAVETLFEGWNGSAPPAGEDQNSIARRQVSLAVHLLSFYTAAALDLFLPPTAVIPDMAIAASEGI